IRCPRCANSPRPSAWAEPARSGPPVPPNPRHGRGRSTLRHVVEPVLGAGAAVGVELLVLAGAQFHAADLAGDRLGQLGELEPPDALVRGEVLPRVAEDLAGRVRGGRPAR